MTPLYDSKQVLTETSIDYFLAMEDLDKVAEKNECFSSYSEELSLW